MSSVKSTQPVRDASPSRYRPAIATPTQVWSVRLAYLLVICLSIYHHHTLQVWVNSTWDYLLTTWVFNSVYFETWWATFCYPWLLAIPFLMSKVSDWVGEGVGEGVDDCKGE